MLKRWGEWLNRHEQTALAVLLAFYAAIVLAQATLKLVWADELITFYIARQPGWSGIWHALQAGTDPNPPLTHILVQASTRLLGGNALAMRLPAMLCVLLAIVSMWFILRRWVRPVFVLAGCLAFMATRGFDYAFDARSYAPMMGFAMASLALWLWSRDLEPISDDAPAGHTSPPSTGRHSDAARVSVFVSSWRRAAALTGMAFALAAGISSNYYCVLAFFPIAAGELASRRFRPAVWFAMAVAALPLLAYLPLIRHNIAEFAPHAWNRPHWSMIPMTYLELVEGIFWPVLGLGLWATWRRGGPSGLAWGFSPSIAASQRDAASAADRSRTLTRGLLPQPLPLSRSERAALAVLLLYPFLGFAIALAGAGMISPRCVAPVCCGIGLAAALLAQRLFGESRRNAMSLVLILTLWVAVREGVCATVLLEQRKSFFALRDDVARQHREAGNQSTGGTRILVADSSFALPLVFYSNREISRSIIFPIDFEAIDRMEKDDSGERNLWAGRTGVFQFRIDPMSAIHYEPFVCGLIDTDLPREAPKAGECKDVELAVARPGGWLDQALNARGYRLSVTGDTTDWDRVGGVFTPMAHPETRLMFATRSPE